MRVCSVHPQVHVTVGEVVHHVVFAEDQPGRFTADLEDVVAEHLLTKIGQAGGFWTDEVVGVADQEEPHASTSPEESESTQQKNETGEDPRPKKKKSDKERVKDSAGDATH